jgi:glucokinase-like ROK family protein
MKKATQQQTKEHNRNLVLKTILERDSISRAEVARVTGLTRTTVSDIVTDLLDAGLVEEVGVGSSKGGKSPILLSLVPDSRCLIGLDLAQYQFRGAVVNLRGAICEMVTMPVTGRDGEALALVYTILDRLVRASCRPIVGIGVGTPGLVNTGQGVVISAVNLDWVNLPLAALLQERYRLPVTVLNDSQAAAMGEYTYGEAHSYGKNLVVINARHGIGAGVIINGRLFQGDGGGAGEIGHVVVVPDGGLPCRCGNNGCLETVASAQALVKRAQALGAPFAAPTTPSAPEAVTLDAIERAFHAGDPVARQIVLEAARYMGMAVSSLVGTLNIQHIVLVGEVTRFGEPWLAAVRETMARTSLSRLAQETRVEMGQLGGNGIVLGASAVLANNYSALYEPQALQAAGDWRPAGLNARSALKYP